MDWPKAFRPWGGRSCPAAALQGKNSWSSGGYRGPAPPKGHGVHRYFFKLYALDKALNLAEGLDKPSLLKAIKDTSWPRAN